MKQVRIPQLLAILILFGTALVQAQPQQPPAPRVVDLKVPDGTVLHATYFAAAKPGPGVLLFHQSNRTRTSWDDVAAQLAGAGINVLTVDVRERPKYWALDLDTSFDYLLAQPRVAREVIGVGGAGVLGVEVSVETARRHSGAVKSLVLLSGETSREGLQFLHQASQLPALFVASDLDEYPPTTEAMELLYVTSSSPSKKFVHYVAAEEAPWLWYEPFDIGRVPATGNHGTDLFPTHPELPGIIVHWFVTTLLKTAGHAPADSVAAAAVLNQLQVPGGAALVKQQLVEARRTDPQAQLFPEITASIIGQDNMRAGDLKAAIEVLQLVLLAYPDSADANETLAEAYLADGQKDVARQHAERALAILDAHTLPASSWTDTEQYRGEIRSGAQKVLDQLSPKQP
jgi:hypothetical protein